MIVRPAKEADFPAWAAMRARRLLDDAISHRWHAAVGFAEVERLVVFGKTLG
jgi:hypothetical protein